MSLAKRFIDGITSKQLEEFVNSVFKLTDKKEIDRIFDCLEDDVTKFYKNIIKTDKCLSSSNGPVIATDHKFEEEFNSLLSKLNSCIMVLGDEEGEYIDQEHHWNSPEFDAYSFSFDIDKIFKEILPLLDRVYELEFEEKDFLLDILEEIKDGIDDFPEWMGAEYSDFALDKYGAECILKWNWLNRESIRTFLTETKAFLDKAPCTDNFTQSFLLNESKENLKDLYNELCSLKKEIQWSDIINDAKSIWHDLYHTSQHEADEKAFLHNSQKMINQKWEYGIPVYQNYIKEGDLQNAEQCCTRTIIEFFIQNINGNFNSDLENTLYATHSNKKDDRLDLIFNDWIKLLEQLNRTDRLSAAEIQYSFYLNSNDWDKIRNTFLNHKNLPYYDNYIEEWKMFEIRNALPRTYSKEMGETWISWLLNFVLDNDTESFISKTTEWLSSPIRVSTYFDRGEDFQLLLLLSKETMSTAKVLDSYPILKQYIFTADHASYFDKIIDPDKADKISDTFRKSYLKLAGANSLTGEIIDTWKNNVEKFIPSPADVHKADYSRHAKWLAIAKELNLDTYQKFHNDWKLNHWRKRNLWSALSNYGIHK